MTKLEQLESEVTNLLSAIDRRWSGETQRKRSTAFSPRMVTSINRLAEMVGVSVETTSDLDGADDE